MILEITNYNVLLKYLRVTNFKLVNNYILLKSFKSADADCSQLSPVVKIVNIYNDVDACNIVLSDIVTSSVEAYEITSNFVKYFTNLDDFQLRLFLLTIPNYTTLDNISEFNLKLLTTFKMGNFDVDS